MIKPLTNSFKLCQKTIFIKHKNVCRLEMIQNRININITEAILKSLK